MHARRESGTRPGTNQWLGVVLVALLAALAVLPVAGLAQDQAAKAPAPASALPAILDRLHGALDALDDRAADGVGWTGLRKELEEVRALLEKLTQELGTPPASGQEPPSVREEVVKLDLRRRRLVETLERFADRAEPDRGSSAARQEAKETLAELRTWVEGYVSGVTARLDRLEPSEFERLARGLLKEVEERLAENARPGAGGARLDPKLEGLVREIERLLDRLNEFVLRSFVPSPREGATTRP